MDYLRDYQREAVESLSNGKILKGSVGSGKSRTGLVYWYEKVCGGDCHDEHNFKPPTHFKDLIIITTAKKRDDKEWEKELAPFGLIPGQDNIIIDSWQNIHKYVNCFGIFFIFDEDHVTGKGKWVKCFYKIARKNQWIILTATPGDNYEQFIPVFVANGYFRNRTQMLMEHAIYAYNSKYPKIIDWRGRGRLNAMRRNVLVQMDYKHQIEITKKDVYCDYDRVAYKELWKNRWNLEKNKPVESISELCYLLRLTGNLNESRVEACKELLEKHSRVIIFYNFDSELELLEGQEWGCKVAVYNGHKHEFIPNTKKWIYLVNYGSGSEAWNCITCNAVIFYSQNYSYKTMVQAAGRIDRMDTPFDHLYYYYLKSKSPIDIAIDRALLEKKMFNEKDFIKGGK